VLRVNISRLRQKLEENPRRPTYIVTVPGQGYWMPTGRP
jgi:DNA-binding response OmpR family regulator